MPSCIEWKGTKTNWGYGVYREGGKYIGRAHRVVYAAFFGDIPPGQQINHHCDNKACINPTHLYVGTQLDNMRDKVGRGRHKNRRNMSLCVSGQHPMIEGNLYWSNGYRRCRQCRRISNARCLIKEVSYPRIRISVQ